MDDDYEHIPSNVFYIVENIPGPGANEMLFNEQLQGCTCNGNCVTDACDCVRRYGTMTYLQGAVEGPIVECNSMCSCSAQCGNRAVQFGPRKGLQVFNTTTGVGYGLKTNLPINKDQFICEYAGELISIDEAKKRSKSNFSSNYIFVLKEHTGENTNVTVVDPRHFGNIGRYANHSCEPNMYVTAVRINSPVPKICLFASRAIYPGEELTFNYGGSDDFIASQTNCKCGSSKCKGFLPFDSSLF